MTIQYLYGLLIIGMLSITTLLTGSSISTDKTKQDTIQVVVDTVPPEGIDTMMLKRLVKEKVSAMIEEQVNKIDSIKDNLLDSAAEVQKSLPPVRIKHWKRHVDIEKRPHINKDKSIAIRIYKWTWWYWIQKRGTYRDTAWDKVQIERIQ